MTTDRSRLIKAVAGQLDSWTVALASAAGKSGQQWATNQEIVSKAEDAIQQAVADTLAHIAIVRKNNPDKPWSDILGRSDVQEALTQPFLDAEAAVSSAITKAWTAGQTAGLKDATTELKALGLTAGPAPELPDTLLNQILSDANINATTTRAKFEGALVGDATLDDAKAIGVQLQLRAKLGADAAGQFAYNQTKETAYSAFPALQKTWVAHFSPTTCQYCRQLHGTTVPVGEPFPLPAGARPPYGGALMGPQFHPNCLVPDTRVAAQKIRASSVRWYDGDVVTVRTALGYDLTCTPNHPILTSRGWMAAGKLLPGMQVVSSNRTEWVVSGDYNNDYMPPTIEEVAVAFRCTHEVSAREVPVAAEDFHGDGGDSQVAVVRSHGLLLDRRESLVSQKVAEQNLARSYAEHPFLPPLSAAALFVPRVSSSTHSLMCLLRESLAFFRSAVGHAAIHGSTAVSGLDSSFLQASSDSWSADGQLLSQSLLTHSSEIALDDVVAIEIFAYHGEVLNLETAQGWYMGNGIVTHNCRCTLAPHMPGQTQPEKLKAGSLQEAAAEDDPPPATVTSDALRSIPKSKRSAVLAWLLRWLGGGS